MRESDVLDGLVLADFLPKVEASVQREVNGSIERAERTSGDSAWQHWIDVATLIANEMRRAEKIDHQVAKSWISRSAAGMGAIGRSEKTQATYRNRAAYLAYLLAQDVEAYEELWRKARIAGQPSRRPNNGLVRRLVRTAKIDGDGPTDQQCVEEAIDLLNEASKCKRGRSEVNTPIDPERSKLAAAIASLACDLLSLPIDQSRSIVMQTRELISSTSA